MSPRPATTGTAPEPPPGLAGLPRRRTGGGRSAAGSGPSRRFLARATLLSAALSMAGAVLGLGRDQTLAHLFGAGVDSDAFLVAWTLPEMASTLLIEDGMAFLLVPAFSVALARRARGTTGPDPVRGLVAASLPRLCLVLAGTAAVLAATAPSLVSVLAPGLPDPSLAVSCTRLTATCVLSFGLAGYFSAALRAHRNYLAPGAIYIAYNIAIIATMFVLAGRWGVRAAALGVALGGCVMAAVQAPSVWRRITKGQDPGGFATASADDGTDGPPLAPALVCAVLLFTLCRQSQVLIERYFASGLPAGAISHLNYAQKVAQLPMSLSMMVCVVTFPVMARAIAEGDLRRARDRVERDLALMGCLVLLGAAMVVACAPQIVQLLFQRGAFTAQDTAATAAVMRVYAVGLLGHTLVGALVRSYFSTGRTTWFPLGAMVLGALVTVVVSAWAVDPWGAPGLAAANAAGITLTALLLLHGLGPRRVPGTVPVCVRRVVAELSRTVRAAVCAAGAGLLCAGLFDSPAAAVAVGCTGVAAVFLLLVWLLDAADARSLLLPVTHSVRSSLTRRLRHGR
ncbi:membrane protein [Streptomyces viridochromogenes]|uniref:Membrane protein n=1 Tax=Streptomyces viridochromogenes TaxID=1938 RepID=A0A0J7Z3I8_STRVR|nr:lipid II flippase MurJ [Streptomyces viridochromogenes]KMS70369.1 membrane protein [Streptomyces viridochromogenes]KOG17229.1 membrane protein [Streptomyces viridochromogenes]KOG20207.1 membrane protein [Streptomyces viridochromogenes]